MLLFLRVFEGQKHPSVNKSHAQIQKITVNHIFVANIFVDIPVIDIDAARVMFPFTGIQRRSQGPVTPFASSPPANDKNKELKGLTPKNG